MKSCVTCVFALDYEFSPACERCFRHSNWTAKPNAQPKPATNADRIRSMTDEELKDFLYSYAFCEMCKEGCGECSYKGDCERRLADWLKQPYKEGKEC